MLTDVNPVRANKRIGNSVMKRAAVPLTRVTPNAVIVPAGIAILFAALTFLELRVGHLAIDSSALLGSGTTNQQQLQLTGEVGSPPWQ